MTTPILHHFDISPFAEKAKVALGIKQAEWQSVQIPLVMPKPDLTLLTGGYRKTPVLQIGANIYCDTQRIALELERGVPGSSLFPQGEGGQAAVLSAWADQFLFRPGAALSMGTNLDLPEDILADRFAFFDFLDRESLPAQLPDLFAQFRANLQRLEQSLADGRAWLLGDAPSWADAACYAPVWMCRGNIAGAEGLLSDLPRLLEWEQRVQQLGHGQRSEITAADSHAVANACSPQLPAGAGVVVMLDIDAGSRVQVIPDDYGAVPVSGELLCCDLEEIVIQRHHEQLGDVCVHFPRIGYRVEAL